MRSYRGVLHHVNGQTKVECLVDPAGFRPPEGLVAEYETALWIQYRRHWYRVHAGHFTNETWVTIDKAKVLVTLISTGDNTGPWEDGSEPDEHTWEAYGLACNLYRNSRMSWCGYVGVVDDHPAAGRETHELRGFKVHGGITYSGRKTDSDKWWIGFDCGHHHDYIPAFGKDNLAAKAEDYRTFEYAYEQCEQLAKQLSEYVV